MTKRVPPENESVFGRRFVKFVGLKHLIQNGRFVNRPYKIKNFHIAAVVGMAEQGTALIQ